MSDDKHAATTIAISQAVPGEAICKGTLTFPNSDRKIVLLLANKMLIGRDNTCDIVLDDSGISRKHALISIEYDQAKFSELNSSNGSFRGDERIVDDILLVDGETIDIAHAFDIQIGVAERNEAVSSVSVTVGETRYILFQNEIIFGGPTGGTEDAPEADCVLPEDDLAPQHAQLEFLFNDVVISSLVDDNLVIVGDTPQKSAELKDYTSFKIGATTFVWRSPEE